MKLSEQWLREWVNPTAKTDELVAQLSMAGLEVDAVAPAAPPFTGVVVGHIREIAPHPNADRLRVCQVDVGEPELLTVVCGAANARQDLKAPLARVGAVLPGDLKIKKGKLRGVESFGMLCSAKELGLAETSEGLLELPADAVAGQDIRAALQLDDVVIEVDLTPNRSDCLSVAGIAREVGVLNRCAVRDIDDTALTATITDTFPVQVSAVAECPRYLGRVIRNLNPQAETPLWMRERLRRCGMRSLGPLVDVTNYVLMELGQPLHAFDLAKLRGGIDVRLARAGERTELLDGQSLGLAEGTLVIADGEGVQALAGVMGGALTAVGDDTHDVFLECAYFAPEAIAGKARSYGLHTESSHRFERGVDPELQRRAIERASRLLIDIAGGQAGPVTEVVAESHLPARPTITLRQSRVRQVLGIDLPTAEIEEILTRLAMRIEAVQGGWRVTPPSFRFDIAIEVDLIEELARVRGYNQIPSTRYHASLYAAGVDEADISVAQLRRLLIGRGYQEVVTYSFVDPGLQAQLLPDAAAVALANPLSSEMSVMRTGLWPGLIKTLAYNQSRQQQGMRIFEAGLRYVLQGNEIKQDNTIAGLLAGDLLPAQWAEPGRPLDFFDAKADVEALLGLTGTGDSFSFHPSAHPALHPGQNAAIQRQGAVVGRIGLLHPELESTLDLTGPVFLFELDLAGIGLRRLPRFTEISKFPAIRRDLAVVLDNGVSAADLGACVRSAAGDLLKDLQVFDVYTGRGVESGRKSIALSLILQDSLRTLKDQDVEAVIARVMTALNQQLNASLRD